MQSEFLCVCVCYGVDLKWEKMPYTTKKSCDFSQTCLQCSVPAHTAATRQVNVFVLAPMTDVICVL